MNHRKFIIHIFINLIKCVHYVHKHKHNILSKFIVTEYIKLDGKIDVL